MATYEIWLCKDTGERLEPLTHRIREFTYAKTTNGVGSFALKTNANLPFNFFARDQMIQIWRAPMGGLLKLDMLGFLNRWTLKTARNGAKFYVLNGPDINDLLNRRIVAAKAGTVNAIISNLPADDGMKQIARSELGAGAILARQMANFTVRDNTSEGLVISKGFSNRNVMTVLQDIGKASRESGTEIFFQVRVSLINRSFVPALEFLTTTGQPGIDRSWSTGRPPASVVFGEEWGNLANLSYGYDYYNELNYVYAGGQGEGEGRPIQEEQNEQSVNFSVYGRREGFKDARNVVGVGEALSSEARTLISERRPRTRFSAELLDTPLSRYGRDWAWGDKITLSVEGDQFPGVARTVIVKVGRNGKEIIKSKVEAEIS